jgi:hypothetical protein
MKRLSKERLITLIIIVCVILLAIFIINREMPKTDKQISKCIGRNSVLYVRLGCHFCQIQEDMFGDNYQYLNTVDCFYQEDKCGNITATPTWIIKKKMYEGVQSIEELKNLTGC